MPSHHGRAFAFDGCGTSRTCTARSRVASKEFAVVNDALSRERFPPDSESFGEVGHDLWWFGGVEADDVEHAAIEHKPLAYARYPTY